MKSADLTDDAVNNTKLSDNAVTSAEVLADSIGGASLDESVIQKRIGAGCTSGNAIREVAGDGTVTCDTTTPSGSTGGDLAGTYPSPTLKQPESFRAIGAAGQPTFQNGWQNSLEGTAASFYRDPFGRVYLRGRIRNGTLGSVPAFTLPAGYGMDYNNPGLDMLDFSVPTNTGYGRVQIEDSGTGAAVQVEEGGAPPTSPLTESPGAARPQARTAARGRRGRPVLRPSGSPRSR